jgi:hypothetical protein
VESFLDRDLKEARGTFARKAVSLSRKGVSQRLFLPLEEKEEILCELEKAGAFVIQDEEIIKKLKRISLSPMRIPGNLQELKKSLGDVFSPIKRWSGRKAGVLIVQEEGPGNKNYLPRKLPNLIMSCRFYGDFEEGAEEALEKLAFETGEAFGVSGPVSGVLFSKNKSHIDSAARLWPVARLYVNSFAAPGGQGKGAPRAKALSGKITYRELMRTTKVMGIPAGAGWLRKEEKSGGILKAIRK